MEFNPRVNLYETDETHITEIMAGRASGSLTTVPEMLSISPPKAKSTEFFASMEALRL